MANKEIIEELVPLSLDGPGSKCGLNARKRAWQSFHGEALEPGTCCHRDLCSSFPIFPTECILRRVQHQETFIYGTGCFILFLFFFFTPHSPWFEKCCSYFLPVCLFFHFAIFRFEMIIHDPWHFQVKMLVIVILLTKQDILSGNHV